MLLLHQTGSVKIGEVVRYTVTYKPSADHILPSPEFLYLRIKNTCAIALRAAFVHGPYTLGVAAYPATFKPFEKFENPRRYGVPEFEPMLKAGAVWNCHLIVPDNIRQSAGEGSSRHGHFGSGPEHDEDTVSWVIEVSSQVIFSASASVHYEILLARDEKSLNLGSVVPVIGGQVHVPQPGRVSDFQQSAGAAKHHPAQPRGVFSKAIHVKVQDTAALWNTPEIPGWDDIGWLRAREDDGHDPAIKPGANDGNSDHTKRSPKHRQKKVHLVVLTHGLHSNLGGDMLFMKESIDATVKQAKADAKARKARERAKKKQTDTNAGTTGDLSERSNQTSDPKFEEKKKAGSPATSNLEEIEGKKQVNVEEEEEEEDDDDDEEVIVRGYSGNAAKTERGIKYLGKRLARYILLMTFPDQPCLPTAKAASEAITHSLKSGTSKKAIEEAHKHSSAHLATTPGGKRLYKFTKISFIAHSLGGLVQMYAIAYIQKHSPQFFDLIEPINFIALASPFLGLNHENPLYVKFALDFGLVGRTGQDLGLTWRAPTIARNGWGALMSNLGEHAHKRVYGEYQPESKPLLRILPTGPAHRALKKFRNRTVYSNVVNDGIVPLRTSCLLFLDWQGLGRVEKARREAGLMETVVGFGWAELTGANVTAPRLAPWSPVEEEEKDEAVGTGKTTPTSHEDSRQVPQPPSNAMLEDDRQSLRSIASPYRETPSELQDLQNSSTTTSNPFSGIFNFFRNETPKSSSPASPKVTKIYQRSQTLKPEQWAALDSGASSNSKVTSGNELTEEAEGMSAPPRTSIFESAGDLLNPKLPPVEFLIDPSKRPRTIFHDRVYHPADIPPPPVKERSSSTLNLLRRTPPTNASQKSGHGDPSSPPTTQTTSQKDTPLSQHTQQCQQSKQTTTSSTPASDGASTVHSPSLDTITHDGGPGGAKASEELPDVDIDTSQMRVEEKIARAYHRRLSWRKVLVKLEPDAHNNIIVRRTFANAFGWPVVQHLVEAHFSDSATARRRDEDEPNAERARPVGERTDEGGGETKAAATGVNAKGEGVSIRERGGKVVEEEEDDDDHDGEKGDTVPELRQSPRLSPPLAGVQSSNALGVGANQSETISGGSDAGRTPTTPRPPLDRLDSVTWSDRDWADSGDESDDGVGGKLSGAKKEVAAGEGKGKKIGLGIPFGVGGGDVGVGGERSSSALSWNWAEKIVGKGGLVRSKSPPGGSRAGSAAGKDS
ncbi:putative serine esterase-domain-containing protein [Corynascus novoguineensis]|uniref:Serine esterase-domain-containing protein n=1 Tax=Corynascus novoguineensis TaxID=1126955 RepID=A0AAN7D0V4_9PEZI|nr:putative serine esterase-domain-containing protein [Corynascus novoguineensis]